MTQNNTPKIPTIEDLNTFAARAREHSEAITNAARMDVANDLLMAARIADGYAEMRGRIVALANSMPGSPIAELLRDLLVEEI